LAELVRARPGCLLLDRPTALRPAGLVHAVRLISRLTGQPPCVEPSPWAPSGWSRARSA